MKLFLSQKKKKKTDIAKLKFSFFHTTLVNHESSVNLPILSF